jgi:Flp pilus assembly protein TadD
LAVCQSGKGDCVRISRPRPSYAKCLTIASSTGGTVGSRFPRVASCARLTWARKLLPGLPDPRMNLALTLERAGRTEEALATYATALEVYPDHLATMEALALLQVRSGKRDERTDRLLSEIALRGESERWREWAQLERARSSGQ